MASVLKLADISVPGILIGKKFKKLSDSQKIIPCKLSRGSVYVQTPPVTLGSGIKDGRLDILDQRELFDTVLRIDQSIQTRLAEKWPDVFSGISDVYKSPITVLGDRSLVMKCSVATKENKVSAGLYNKYGETISEDSLHSGTQVILILNLKGILLYKGVITVSWEIAQLKLYTPPQKRVPAKLSELSIVEESECENDDDIILPYHDETEPVTGGGSGVLSEGVSLNSDISPVLTEEPAEFCISEDSCDPEDSFRNTAVEDPISEDEASESSRSGIVLI